MDLTARDAARMLNVPEERIHAWIRNGTLPSYRVKDRYRLNRVELLEWARARSIQVSPEFFRGHRDDKGKRVLADALGRGGVLHDVECVDKASALRAVSRLVPLPETVDRGELHGVLVAREALCSTGIGNGIAIPHPRGSIVLGLNESQVTLVFLRQPVEYGALDGEPVGVLFVIISTTVHIHLVLLSHLMFALQDAAFRGALDRRDTAEAVLARCAEVEDRILRVDRTRGDSA